jgi:hypothetical protein
VGEAMTDRRSHPILTGASILAALAVLYVLAEAPLFKLTTVAGEVPAGGVWNLWKPLDWLNDKTALNRPIHAWWSIFGRENAYDAAEFDRGGPAAERWLQEYSDKMERLETLGGQHTVQREWE